MVDRWLTVNHVRLALSLVLVLLVTWLALRGCGPAQSPMLDPNNPTTQAHLAEMFPESERVTIAGRTFELELALDDSQRHQGLSDRTSIPADGGMLFVFPEEGYRTFVMRRCLVPIDLIYLDGEGRVINTHQMAVEPYGRPDWFLEHYSSDAPAQYVIELAGGTLDELDLEADEQIDLPAGLKERAR